MMLKGMPSVYQEEELSLTNVYFEKFEDYRNCKIFGSCNDFFKNGSIDIKKLLTCFALRFSGNAGTPMQWDWCENASFTARNPNYTKTSAKVELNYLNSINNYEKKRIQVRKSRSIFVSSKFELQLPDSNQTLVYK